MIKSAGLCPHCITKVTDLVIFCPNCKQEKLIETTEVNPNSTDVFKSCISCGYKVLVGVIMKTIQMAKI